ncbi:CCAAT-box binding factor HAP3-like protein [Senna tora]|uniref:CCAAT-box binding factor HAP3-like protein n=1 Tax=Senna tora TaxID=362788 RepID=A0A834SPW6_9FABA|nr:CCAAT-box binding factor HAP3-like protein [Senna tora]
MQEPIHYVPLANLTRIMRQILPENTRISEDAKQTLQVCVSAFIRFLTNKAKERCQQDCRVTITPEDILWAGKNLGFNDYVEPLTIFLSRLRDVEDFNILPVVIPATQNQDVDPTNTGINEEQPIPHVAMREPIHYVPLANLTRIMRQILPENTRISEDAKQTLQVSVSAFIRFLTSKAKERCQQDCRVTITPEDMLWAVRNLGFNDFVEPLTIFLSRLRDVEGEHYSA